MPLSIYKRGDIWHYRGTAAGRRLRGSTGTADKATAQRIAAEIEARQWKGHLDGPAAVLTFAQAAILYRRAGKPTRFLAAVEDYWKDTLVKDITSGAVRKAAMEILPGTSGATMNRNVIVPTQAVINHAAESELCQYLKVKRFPVIKREKTPATWQWVQAFMAATHPTVPHLGALACFMFLTGARISEALAVTWQDIDLQGAKAKISMGKIGGEVRTAHLPAPLLVALANLPGDRVGRVFVYSSRSTAKTQWNAYVRRAGIKKLSFHACRHGFATAMLHRGVDPVTIAKRGGWKSPAHVFATYGHAMDDETVTDRIIDTPVAQKQMHQKKKKGGASA